MAEEDDSIAWTDEREDVLIDYIFKNECLWKKDTAGYANRKKRFNLYAEIGATLNVTASEIEKHYNSMRSTSQRKPHYGKSGSEPLPDTPRVALLRKKLSFLAPYVKSRRTKSTLKDLEESFNEVGEPSQEDSQQMSQPVQSQQDENEDDNEEEPEPEGQQSSDGYDNSSDQEMVEENSEEEQVQSPSPEASNDENMDTTVNESINVNNFDQSGVVSESQNSFEEYNAPFPDLSSSNEAQVNAEVYDGDNSNDDDLEGVLQDMFEKVQSDPVSPLVQSTPVSPTVKKVKKTQKKGQKTLTVKLPTQAPISGRTRSSLSGKSSPVNEIESTSNQNVKKPVRGRPRIPKVTVNSRKAAEKKDDKESTTTVSANVVSEEVKQKVTTKVNQTQKKSGSKDESPKPPSSTKGSRRSYIICQKDWSKPENIKNVEQTKTSNDGEQPATSSTKENTKQKGATNLRRSSSTPSDKTKQSDSSTNPSSNKGENDNDSSQRSQSVPATKKVNVASTKTSKPRGQSISPIPSGSGVPTKKAVPKKITPKAKGKNSDESKQGTSSEGITSNNAGNDKVPEKDITKKNERSEGKIARNRLKDLVSTQSADDDDGVDPFSVPVPPRPPAKVVDTATKGKTLVKGTAPKKVSNALAKKAVTPSDERLELMKDISQTVRAISEEKEPELRIVRETTEKNTEEPKDEAFHFGNLIAAKLRQVDDQDQKMDVMEHILSSCNKAIRGTFMFPSSDKNPKEIDRLPRKRPAIEMQSSEVQQKRKTQPGSPSVISRRMPSCQSTPDRRSTRSMRSTSPDARAETLRSDRKVNTTEEKRNNNLKSLSIASLEGVKRMTPVVTVIENSKNDDYEPQQVLSHYPGFQSRPTILSQTNSGPASQRKAVLPSTSRQNDLSGESTSSRNETMMGLLSGSPTTIYCSNYNQYGLQNPSNIPVPPAQNQPHQSGPNVMSQQPIPIFPGPNHPFPMDTNMMQQQPRPPFPVHHPYMPGSNMMNQPVHAPFPGQNIPFMGVRHMMNQDPRQQFRGPHIPMMNANQPEKIALTEAQQEEQMPENKELTTLT